MRTTSGSGQQPDKIICLDLESIRCSDYSTINCKIMYHFITGSGLMPNYQNYLEMISDKPNDISKGFYVELIKSLSVTNVYSKKRVVRTQFNIYLSIYLSVFHSDVSYGIGL